MLKLRVAGIFALLFLFLLIAVPFVDAQEEVAGDVNEAKDTQAAIKERLARAPEATTKLGEALERIILERIEGKDYTFEEEKKPKEEITITTGKDYIGKENEENKALPPTKDIVEGKDYSSIFIAAGEGLTTIPTDGVVYGKNYPFLGEAGRDTRARTVTALDFMGRQVYTGKDYPSLVEDKPIRAFPAYTFMGGQQYGVQGTPTPDETIDMAANALGTATTMGITGLSEMQKIFYIVINNKTILYTIIVGIFAAVIGKLAGWQVGLIGGSALAVAFTIFSDGGTTLMPAFITGIVVLGSAAMISMAVSKMTGGD